MGRKKLEIKRIEDKSNRQMTLCKRKNGLTKKAKELSILCNVGIGAVIFSHRGKHYDFAAGNSSLDAILQQYHDISDADDRERTGVYVPKNSKYATNRTNGDLLQRIQRYLSELNLDQHNVADLVQLEKELETALAQTRAAKTTVNTEMTMEPITTARNKEKSLREENKFLEQQIAEMKVNNNTNIAATENCNNNTNLAATEKGKGLWDAALETDHTPLETLVLLS